MTFKIAYSNPKFTQVLWENADILCFNEYKDNS